MKIGLALGGGGARGLTHIHIVAALEELGLHPDVIAGSSIGALMGAAYASGMRAKDIEDYFVTTFARTSDVANRLWALKPTSFKELWQRGVRLSQFNVEVILDAFLPEMIPESFDDLQIPFSAVAADMGCAEMVIMKDGDLHSALAASAALPGIFKPVLREERLLMDGGLCNPVPFDCLVRPVDKVIGVDVVGYSGVSYKDRFPSTIESLLSASLISQQAIISARLKYARPDLLLCPPVHGIYVLDFLKSKDILDNTRFYKDEAKRDIEAMLGKAS